MFSLLWFLLFRKRICFLVTHSSATFQEPVHPNTTLDAVLSCYARSPQCKFIFWLRVWLEIRVRHFITSTITSLKEKKISHPSFELYFRLEHSWRIITYSTTGIPALYTGSTHRLFPTVWLYPPHHRIICVLISQNRCFSSSPLYTLGALASGMYFPSVQLVVH